MKEEILKLIKDKYSHPNKLLDKHIKETERISDKLLELFNLPEKTKIRIREMLKELIIFHDLGKIHPKFQDYIKKNKDSTSFSHSSFSSLIYFILNMQDIIFKKDHLKSLVLFLILKHHSTLKLEFDFSVIKNQIDENSVEIIKKLLKNSNVDQEYIEGILPYYNKAINNLINNKNNLEDFLILLFTFGIFLFADRLSAFITDNWEDEKDLEDKIDKLFEELGINKAYSEISYDKFQEFIINLQEKSPKNKINKLRTQAFKEVEENFEKNKDKKIFKITLPTGLGKTLTGLNIALKLNKELKRPIIYSLPFLSIIEQNYQVIKNIFNEEKEEVVGKFHHLTIFNEKEEETNLRDFINFELKPITVTTFIQIFHSIFTNDRNWIIKFPFIATSILIIDETQNLPVSCFEAFDKVLLKMTELFGTRIILMSATQPYLLEKKENNSLIQQNNKKNEKFNNELNEVKVDLVENKENYYVFNRYKIIIKEDLFKEKTNENKESSEDKKNTGHILDLEKLIEEVIKKLKEKQKVGIIVNKVKDSIEIFNELNKKLNFSDLNDEEIEELIEATNLDKESLEINKIEILEEKINKFKKEELKLNNNFSIKEEFKDLKRLIKNNIKKFDFEGKTYYLLYLSANLINLEKKLRSILLKKLENKNLLVISTQVIEVGIDISLDSLFRFIAPLDSIIQSAGRVNRNGFDDLKGELILICDLKGNKDKELWNHVYDKILIEKTKKFLEKLLKDKEDKVLKEKEITNPKKIDNYFKDVRNSKNDESCGLDCGNFIENAIEKLNFDCIGKFSLIENRAQYDLILDLDFEILKNFNEIYEKISEIGKKDKEESIKKLKTAKKLRKIEEFFKATRIGKIEENNNCKQSSLKDFKISELKGCNEVYFKNEHKKFIRTKQFEELIYYDYFGFVKEKENYIIID